MTTSIPSIQLPNAVFETPALSILLPVVLGTAVGFSTQPKETQETYLKLKQPPYRPPPSLFGPVWTALYASMGLAAHRAWNAGINSPSPSIVALTKKGAALYTIQLGLNLIWMPLFFKFKRPIEATVDLVALTGITGLLTYTWGQVDEVAGYLLAPYVAWLSFATYLSAGAGYLNNWDFSGKESTIGPGGKIKKTKFVDEE